MPLDTLTHNRLGRAAMLLLGGICAAAIAADRPISPSPPQHKPIAKPAVRSVAPGESETEILIAQALDQSTEVEFKDVPIREAIHELSGKTGIPIEVQEGTVRFLPYGSETRVTASIHGQPLREVIRALVRPIGLYSTIEKDRVVIRPTRALQRVVRRASWQMLTLLETLRTRPWSEELFQTLKIQFQDSPNEELQMNREQIRKMAQGVGAGMASEVLELATDKFGWTWYPAEDHIVIISKLKQIERQLDRRVTLQYRDTSLKDILLDLTNQANVPLKLDPGVLQTLPASTTENYSFSIENSTVRQALEIVSGQTGLGYVIEPDGVRITTNLLASPPSTSQPAAQADSISNLTVEKLRSNSIVGQITMPDKDGATYSFFIRENDLPADVNELRKAKVKEAGERIRQALLATTHPRD